MLKALEKDRTRRYETVNGLAADLRRYLDNEPIAARPPSALYGLQKLARRNTIAFAAGGAVVLALIPGLVTTSWQARRAERHLQLARLRAYVSDLNAEHRSLADNNLARTLELLDVGSLVAGFTADSRTLVVGPRNGDSSWHLAGAATRTVALATNLDLPGDLLCKPFDVARDRPLGALGCLGGRLELWDLAAESLVAAWNAETNQIRIVAFSADGRTLVTGALDGRVKFWNLATFQETMTLSVPLGASFRSLCFSPDGRTLAIGYLGFPGHYVQLYFAPSLAEIAAKEQDRLQRQPR